MRIASLLLASALLALAQGAPSRAEEPPTVYSQNAQANTLFLEARTFMAKADPHAGGRLKNAREAIRLYNQAIADDPRFALAYVELSRAWLSLNYSDPDGATTQELLPPARAAATKAVELDPSLPQAHLALAALAYNFDYDWPRAEREYQTGLVLQPDNAIGHLGFALYLSSMGRSDEALKEAGNAAALAPSMMTDVIFARIYYSARRYAEAEEACRRSLAKQDNVLAHLYLGLSYLAEDKTQPAITELQAASAADPNGGALAGLAYGYAMAGRKEQALALLAKLDAGTSNGLVVPYRVAAVYVALGDADKAMTWLDRSYAERDNWVNQLKVDPVMDPLRADPRFEALLRKVHLA